MLDLNAKQHHGRPALCGVERSDCDIASNDQEIDEMAYDLYGITGEERKIIGEGL